MESSPPPEPEPIECEYDVVIVGGRPAGASLALRLGRRGVRVLVIDRAKLPSEPNVPSSPIVYAGALHKLDELGIDEAEYAPFCPPFRRFVVEVQDCFRARSQLAVAFGRDYGRAIDRSRFDRLLWDRAAACATVTARMGVSFVDVCRDARGRVSGILARRSGGAEVEVRARCVVGADGRFSAVARKVDAKVVDDAPWTSTVYLADWEGVRPFDDEDEPLAHVYTTARGLDLLFLPRPEGRLVLCTHQRSDRVDVQGDAEAYYRGVTEAHPSIARRLEGARRVGRLLGMKRVANRYHEAAGPGWLLVGDALHHKDPVDGQGIYDALAEGECAERAVASILDGADDAEAARAYDREARAATHAMFEATVGRLRRELYSEPPAFIMKTAMRWMLTDPEYQRQFALFLSRAIPPETWYAPSMLAGAMVRGAMRDLARPFAARPPA